MKYENRKFSLEFNIVSVFVLLAILVVDANGATPTCNGKTVTKHITSLSSDLGFKLIDSNENYSDKVPTKKYYLLKNTSKDDVFLLDIVPPPPSEPKKPTPVAWPLDFLPPGTFDPVVLEVRINTPPTDLVLEFDKGNNSLCVANHYRIANVYVRNVEYLEDKENNYNLTAFDMPSNAKVLVSGWRTRIYIDTVEGDSGEGADISIESFNKSVDIKTGKGNDSIKVAPCCNDVDRITINTGSGNDEVYAALHVDDNVANVYINGGNGNDNLQSWGNAKSIIVGGVGKDSVYASGQYGFLAGGKTAFKNFNELKSALDKGDVSTLMDDYDPTDDEDLLDFDGDTHSNSLILGSNGNDLLYGGKGKDYIKGYAKDDYIDGDSEDDVLYGDDDDDEKRGGGGSDKIYGGKGQDLLHGDSGEDFIYGNEESDRLWGGSADDLLKGGDGNDELYGEGDDDKLYGEDGDDLLKGGSGRDQLYGNNDADTLFGNEDEDELNGGANSDTCIDSSGTSKTSCEK